MTEKGKRSGYTVLCSVRCCGFSIRVYLTQRGATVWKALRCLSSLSRKLANRRDSMVWFLRHRSVCTCISCHHLYCKGCIGGLGYVTQTKQILAWRIISVITEQVRTDYRFSLLTLSLSCSVPSFHIASPSVTPVTSLLLFFFGFFHSRLRHHRVTVVMAAHVISHLLRQLS